MKEKIFYKRIEFKILIIILLVVFLLIIVNLNLQKPLGIAEPKPTFSVKMKGCKFDGTEEGIFSFFFKIEIENETRLPAQFILKTKDVFIYDYNITSEYKIDRIYKANETVNVSFVIDNVYEDYIYWPNENFNIELFYCEFIESQKEYLKNIIPFHEILDKYCLSIFDYAKVYKVPYIHVVVQNPGEQCTVIIKDVEGNIKIYES